jgi:hypothetical protein
MSILTSLPSRQTCERSTCHFWGASLPDITCSAELRFRLEGGGVHRIECQNTLNTSRQPCILQLTCPASDDNGFPCSMCTPETGSVLNRIVHFYAYESLAERERCRKAMINRSQWTDFLQRSRPYVIGPQVSGSLIRLCCPAATKLWKAVMQAAADIKSSQSPQFHNQVAECARARMFACSSLLCVPVTVHCGA